MDLPFPFDRPTIVVVDDNPVELALVSRILEREGFAVLQAENGAAALALCEHAPPALVIADIVMPAMDGLEFCRAFRRQSQDSDVQILVATALREHDAIASVYAAGANDIITKPLDPVVLINRVHYMLRAAQAFREMRMREHAQRLEALGILAGGMAHDLNNVLVPIMALSKMSARQAHLDPDVRETFTVIHHASEQARDLVKRVLAFSRNDVSERVEIKLHEVVEEALKLLRATIPATTQIEVCLAEIPPLWANPTQIHQVLTNLVANAASAIGDKHGKITVTLELVRSDAAVAEARLSVADTGGGMDESTQARIFQPFFTTKPVGEGTGLGLSVVYGIVTSHRGRIAVKSEPGKGSQFDVYFPLPAQSAVSQHAAA